MRRLPTGIINATFFENGERLYKLANNFSILKKAKNHYIILDANNIEISTETKLEKALKKANNT